MSDWRNGSSCMSSLVAKLYKKPFSDSTTDINFKLPDGGTVPAHRLILAIGSPYFEAQFYGLLASDHNGTIEIKDVDSSAFRRLLDYIYNSGPLEWDMDSIEFWNLLHAAHMYLVPGLIEHCNHKLSDFMTSLDDTDELIAHVNRACQLYIYEDIARAGVLAIKEKLKDILPRDSWLTLQQNVVLELVEDVNLKVSEGELFSGMVKWCRANTDSEEEAIMKFQHYFADKIIVKNVSQDTFLSNIGPSNFLSAELFKNWTFEVMKNKVKDASRYALNPYKVQQTSIDRKDFLEQRLMPANHGNGQGSDADLWTISDEFADVDIDVKIYQKISEGVHVPRGKFGILLETVHTSKGGSDKSAITERVSVKMVAKRSDGTVMKKLFKPIEDSFRESRNSRTNIFVLSKNKEERLQWHLMEIVVILDRRPKCHIKGISGENFAKVVSTAPTVAYLEQALSFSYDINMSLKDCLTDMSERLDVKERDLTTVNQWLYIFTKGFVSNLRSRRALPNDYWTAETVGDYMRCKVINFPIGVQNEGMRREAFKTWIVSRKLAEEKEKEKKNLLVVTYNRETQEVNYIKNICIHVNTKVETLGLQEHINLGTMQVTEQFFSDVLFGTTASTGARVFLRRIFPVQDECYERMERLVVTEAVLGENLTHIDDCHVLVIQEGSNGVDYDQFIISKIREIKVQFLNKEEDCGEVTEMSLDPKSTYSEVLKKLSVALGQEMENLELFKCYASKSMNKRPAEFPVDVGSEKNVESLLEWCSEGPSTIFYRLKADSSESEDEQLQESSYSNRDQLSV